MRRNVSPWRRVKSWVSRIISGRQRTFEPIFIIIYGSIHPIMNTSFDRIFISRSIPLLNSIIFWSSPAYYFNSIRWRYFDLNHSFFRFILRLVFTKGFPSFVSICESWLINRFTIIIWYSSTLISFFGSCGGSHNWWIIINVLQDWSHSTLNWFWPFYERGIYYLYYFQSIFSNIPTFIRVLWWMLQVCAHFLYFILLGYVLCQILNIS